MKCEMKCERVTTSILFATQPADTKWKERGGGKGRTLIPGDTSRSQSVFFRFQENGGEGKRAG